MRKAPCPCHHARGHGATTNHHREAGTDIVPASRRENKEEIMKSIQERLKEEILLLTDEQLDYVIKRVNELLADEETKEAQEEAHRNG